MNRVLAGINDNTTRRVLIVEDDPHLCAFLVQVVSESGILALPSRCLAEAMRGLDPLPDKVLLDLHLPDGSGLTLLRHVRERGLAVRVAVTTGSVDRDLLADVELLRPDRVFKKPFGLPQLMAWIKSPL